MTEKEQHQHLLRKIEGFIAAKGADAPEFSQAVKALKKLIPYLKQFVGGKEGVQDNEDYFDLEQNNEPVQERNDESPTPNNTDDVESDQDSRYKELEQAHSAYFVKPKSAPTPFVEVTMKDVQLEELYMTLLGTDNHLSDLERDLPFNPSVKLKT